MPTPYTDRIRQSIAILFLLSSPLTSSIISFLAWWSGFNRYGEPIPLNQSSLLAQGAIYAGIHLVALYAISSRFEGKSRSPLKPWLSTGLQAIGLISISFLLIVIGALLAFRVN